MPKPLHIAIVGFGSAGAASAILLARDGHDVHLFERAPENSPIGAGFLLQPTGLSVIRELGIYDLLLPLTTPIDQLYCINDRHSLMLDLHYKEVHPELRGAGTHRTTLLHLLESEVHRSGASLHWDTEIKRIEQQASKHTLYDAKNISHSAFDLLLVCDGSRSQLRQQVGIPYTHKQYPWGALWFIGKRTEDFSPNQLWQAVSSTDKLCGFLPTGTSDDLLSLFWSIRMNKVDDWSASDLNSWKAQVLEMAPQAESFLQQINKHDDLSVAGYHDVVMKHWHTENVAILGDAAHALSPQLGQGVNLALVDASTLAQCLREQPLASALTSYSSLRRKHLGFYQFATRWATPFFQSDHHCLGALRDLTFPLANKIPWARQQMTSTMAGLKTGTLSALSAKDYV